MLFKNSAGLNMHKKNCQINKDIIDLIIKDYTENFLSIRDLVKKYNIDKSRILPILKGITRTYSESIVISRRKNPERYKHSDETKAKLRNIRLKWMKENPEKTAWRKYNLSYPEKIFLDKIKELKWDEKYLIIREKCVFPYFIDFAFENMKIAIEIDGSQHLEDKRKKSDENKDNLLCSQGWKVIRFTENEIKKNLSGCISLIEDVIVNRNLYTDVTRVGIFCNNQIKNYCVCGKEINKRSKNCIKCSSISVKRQRKVERPSYNNLLKEVETIGYTGVAKKCGVSPNTVKKWIKMYQKHGENF